ncbi:MAG: CHAT domain-containing protein, partial [Bacteroidota bacterium]
MSSALPVLFLSFAHQATDPLPKLIEEEKSIRDQLHSRAQQQHYFVHPESYATPDSLRSYLSEFTGRVWLFHYAGHANSQQLMLSDGRAEASGIAKMLAEQPMLKLVFLNGCSTQAQVKQLLALGVPAVIATHAPIEDELARRFAEHFYHALSLGASIGEAFG